jgi:hypothetical protein
MTAWQKLSGRLRASGSEDGEEDGEAPARTDHDASAEPEDPWENAPVRARVARRAAEALFGWRVSPARIPLLTNVMHWGYGTSWGVPYGVWAGSAAGRGALRAGALFGLGLWATSYAQLVPMGLYEPPWRYPAKDLALDLSYHLVYGVGTGAALQMLERRLG